MKKIITTLLAFSIMAPNAYAQLTVNEPAKDLQNGIITISGSNSEADLKDSVNIFVVNPGFTLNDVKTGTSDALQQYATVNYQNDGTFSFSFKNHTPLNVGDRWYNCYITGDGIDQPVKKSYYFVSTDDMKSQLRLINESAFRMVGEEPTTSELTAFKILLIQSENMFSLKNDFYNNIDLDKLAKNLMIHIKSNQLDTEAFDDFTSLVKLYSVIECFNEGKSDLCFENGEILNSDLLGIDTLDTVKNVTFTSLYKNSVKNSGKAKIQLALLNQNYKNKDEFLKGFGKAVCVNAIKYPTTGGAGHITDILTTNNTDFVEINVSSYINSANKVYYNPLILNSSFETVQELATVVNNLVTTPVFLPGNTVSGENSSPSGGFSYGGSGNTGSSTDYINDIDKNSKNMDFVDVTKDHWAYESIKNLFYDDIISGTSKNTFSPDDYVTREQITKMLVRAFNIETNMDTTSFKFSDTEKDSWYYSYVVTAKNNGIVNGINENTFGIGEYVTRQDIAVMIYRIVGDKLSKEEKEAVFTDSDNISDYAKESVENLYKAGILSGFEDGSFMPFGNCTRAQASTIISNTLKNIGGAK